MVPPELVQEVALCASQSTTPWTVGSSCSMNSVQIKRKLIEDLLQKDPQSTCWNLSSPSIEVDKAIIPVESMFQGRHMP